MDLHNYKRRLEATIKRINNSNISERDKELIFMYKDDCLCRGVSYGKIDAYLFYLKKFSEMLDKEIDKANKEDIKKVIAELNQSGFSEETKVCFKIAVRRLYKLIRGVEGKGKYPEEVEWISTTIPLSKKKIPEELLNEEEIKAMIRAAPTLRDKTLISTLAESGARVSEIGTMKIKQVSFEEYGARLSINGKTGARKILVINSTPYLQEWINSHPYNDNPEAYLWYNQQNKPCLGYARIVAILKLAADKAGIKKRVYPHLLRHGQASRMALVMSESAMKQYFGWTQASKMAGVYVHLSGKDTDEAILRANGIQVKKDEKPKQELKPIRCERCKVINETTNKFCKICGLPLDKKEAQRIIKEDVERTQADEIMNKLIQDDEIKELIKRKLE